VVKLRAPTNLCFLLLPVIHLHTSCREEWATWRSFDSIGAQAKPDRVKTPQGDRARALPRRGPQGYRGSG
jgi:hypothetical protein